MLPVLKYELEVVRSCRLHSLKLRKLDANLRRFFVQGFEALEEIATCMRRRVAGRQGMLDAATTTESSAVSRMRSTL